MIDNDSPLLVTRYGKIAKRLIESLNKHLTLVIALTIAIAIFSIFDILGLLYTVGLYSEYVHDIVIAIITSIMLIFLSLLSFYLFKIRKVLVLWHDLFEESALKTNIALLLKDKSNVELLHAISESIEELNRYINRYIENDDIKRFLDIKINDLKFDLLIDDNTADTPLREIIKEYGAIIGKIINGVANKDLLKRLYNQLLEYNKITGNKVGLAIIIADEIESIELNGSKVIEHLVLLER